MLREVYVLEREDSDYELDGREMIVQDWVVDDEEEYDESFVPPGGFPARPVAENRAPASGFVPSGPRSFPAEFGDESAPVINVSGEQRGQDPWVRDGDPCPAPRMARRHQPRGHLRAR